MQQISVYYSYILLTWWIHLLILIVFVWRLYSFLYRVSCHCKQWQFYLFPSNLDTFYFFSCLVAVSKTSILCWIEVVRVGILVLFPNLVRRLSAFHHWILCWLQVCHKWPIATLVRVFIMNRCYILSNIITFSVSVEMIM